MNNSVKTPKTPKRVKELKPKYFYHDKGKEPILHFIKAGYEKILPFLLKMNIRSFKGRK